MYFAMDEIGTEYAQAIQALPTVEARWAYIAQIAQDFGFTGIHLTPSLYQSFGLTFDTLPEALRTFRLTYHHGGVLPLTCQADADALDTSMRAALATAACFGMEDLSFHPPYAENQSPAERAASEAFLRTLLPTWLALAGEAGVSLSIETHISPAYFLFAGYDAFTTFTDSFPQLGILIDISHNGFDGYDAASILRTFQSRNVRGLHISDADPGAPFRQGTHLPVGQGTLDLRTILRGFSHVPDLYAVLEIKASSAEIGQSLQALQSFL